MPPRSMAEMEADFRAQGFTMPGSEHEPPDTEKFFDLAIMSLPSDHNFVDGLTALISDACTPVPAHQFDNYDRRFGGMIIECDMPVGTSEKVIRDTYGHHSPDHLNAARTGFSGRKLGNKK
jgi:hypothetical protein